MKAALKREGILISDYHMAQLKYHNAGIRLGYSARGGWSLSKMGDHALFIRCKFGEGWLSDVVSNPVKYIKRFENQPIMSFGGNNEN